jgi:integrase
MAQEEERRVTMPRKRRGRGEGSIEQLPSGKWRAILSLGKGVDGNRRKLAETFDTKQQALAWLRQRQAESSRGQLADSGFLTVGEWLDQWLADKKIAVEPNTYEFYEKRVRLHLKPHLGHLRLGKLSDGDIRRLHADLTDKGVPSPEQRRVALVLRIALKAAVKGGRLNVNPAQTVPMPKEQKKDVECFDAAQARRFLAATRQDRLATMYDVWLDAGLRPGEIFGLHWPEVDLGAGTILIKQSLEEIKGRHRLKAPKSRKGRRRIALSPRTVESLRLHRERMRAEGRDVESGPVFCDRKGGWLRQPNVWRWSFSPALVRAGLRHVKPYALRHTSATLLLMANVPLHVVSDRLGHEKIETTLKHYAHYLPCAQERVVSVVQELFGDCPADRTDARKETLPPASPSGSDRPTLSHGPEKRAG